MKAAPLIMIAVGLAIGFRANVWNIGAEGQLTMGAIAGGGVALATWGQAGVLDPARDVVAGILGGMAYAAIPAFLKARFDVSEILTSLMLTYVADAVPQHHGLRALEGPGGLRLPAVAHVHRCGDRADHPRGHAAAYRRR